MATTGHESEGISVQGLKASLQKMKTDIIDPIMGPTYDAANRRVVFPVTAKATYDQANRCIVFG